MKNFTKLLLLLISMCFYTLDISAQANCAGALALTPGTQQCGDSAGQAGDFDGGGAAPSNPCNSNYNDDEYWFSYTAVTEGETLDLTLSGISNTWAGLFVIDDCPSGTPSCIASSTNSSSTADITVSTPGLTAGTSYKIFISNYGTPNSTAFCLDAVVNPPAPPLDYCGADAFVDSGGTGGDYSSSENLNYLICPDVGSDKVTATFTSFAVEDNGAGSCWDELKIYDGDDNTAPQIGPAAGFCYDGTGTNGTGYPGGALGTPITSTAASGCLYFEFTSDGSVTRAGWEADITCGTSCAAPSGSVTLAGGGTTTATVADVCQDANGFTYYEDPGTGNFIFAINWNVSGNGRNDASGVTVTIDKQAAPFEPAGNAVGEASVAMERHWNVNLGGATLNEPVDVRFYYDPAEQTAVNTLAGNYGGVSPWFWWKNNDGTDYTHAAWVTPADFSGNVTILTGSAGMDNGVDYVEFTGITSFSGGSGGAGSGGGLPVELISFEGKAMDNSNMLLWATAAEENTEMHIVERSIDGQNNWSEVGRVAAFGTTVETQTYELEDRSPLAVSYYRLRSVDYDTHTDISSIIRIEREGGSGDVNVYPNPVKEIASVEFELTKQEKVQITLMDVTGKVISTESVAAQKGANLHQINMNTLSSGIYFISFENQVGKQTKRIVKH